MADKSNISTENQPKGAARNPSDTLDKREGDDHSEQKRDDDENPDDPNFGINGD